jgi:hypothetical protein
MMAGDLFMAVEVREFWGIRVNRLQKIALSVSVALVLVAGLGGCMSSAGKNAPLPRLSQDDTTKWAQAVTANMAKAAGVALRPGDVSSAFNACFGENDEVSTDARFQLSYTAYADVPTEEHTSAGLKVRSALEKEGFRIVSFRPYENFKDDLVLYADEPKKDYSVQVFSAGTDPPKQLAFGFSSPCLMPPGATQSPQ